MKKFQPGLGFQTGCWDNEQFCRHHTTQTNQSTLKLKLKKILHVYIYIYIYIYIYTHLYIHTLFSKREKPYILRNHCQNLYKPACDEQISTAKKQ